MVSVDGCPPGTIKDECALDCSKLCLFYSYAVKSDGSCKNGIKCESGCVSAEKRLTCPDGMMWASNSTCVSIHDCLCRSNDGKLVKVRR